MRRILAIVILGSALAATASAAFAEDGLNGLPRDTGTPSVVSESPAPGATVAGAGEYQNPTNPYRQENMVP